MTAGAVTAALGTADTVTATDITTTGTTAAGTVVTAVTAAMAVTVVTAVADAKDRCDTRDKFNLNSNGREPVCRFTGRWFFCSEAGQKPRESPEFLTGQARGPGGCNNSLAFAP